MNSPAKTSAWLILALWAAGLGAAAQFAKIAVIFPTLQQVYGDTGAGLGFAVSLLSFLGIGFGLLAGLLVARAGVWRLLFAALVLGAVISTWQSLMLPLPLLLVSRVIEGMSHLVIVVAAPTLIAQVSAERHRAAAMTVWSTFFGVAFALVAWLGAPLVAAQGPQVLFLIHAGYMLAAAAVLRLLMPTGQVMPDDPTPLRLGQMLRSHVEIYRSPHVSAPALGWLFYTLTFVSLLTVLPPLVPPGSRALVAIAMPLAGIATSMTIGILLLRRFTPVTVVIAGFAVAAAIALLIGLRPANPWLPIALIGALGLVQGASFAAIPQLNPTPARQSHANGAVAQMGNLGNACGTPLLLGAVAGFGFEGMIGFLVLCYGLGIAVHLLQARRRLALPDMLIEAEVALPGDDRRG